MTLLAAPALPLHTAGKYVAAAYVVFVVMLLVYLGIMALRTSRTNRDLGELRREVAERRAHEELPGPSGSPVERPGAGPTETSRREPAAEPPEREPAI